MTQVGREDEHVGLTLKSARGFTQHAPVRSRDPAQVGSSCPITQRAQEVPARKVHPSLQIVKDGLSSFPLQRHNIVGQWGKHLNILSRFAQRTNQYAHRQGWKGGRIVQVYNQTSGSPFQGLPCGTLTMVTR